MADKDAIVRSYAEALFRVAEAEGELDAVERQLFAFAELLERETRVRDALLDPSLPIENKRQLIADTLGERANPLAVNLLGFLVEQGRRGRSAGSSRRSPRSSRRRASGRSPRSARRSRWTTPEPRSWPTRSGGRPGRPIEVRVIVDPSVVGGVVARVGDEIFDGSVRSRLIGGREHLTGTTTRSG